MASLTLILLVLPCAILAEVVRYDGHSVLRVTAHDDAELELIRTTLESEPLLDVWKDPSIVGSPVDFRVSPTEKGAWIDRLASLGLDTTVMIEDVQSLIDKTTPPAHRGPANTRNLDTSRYYTLAEINEFLNEKVTECSGNCEVISMGNSWEGRSLNVIKIGSPVPGVEDSIWIDHGIHAREWISPAVGLYFIERLVTDYGIDPDVTALRDGFNWYIDPVVNPDGYDYTFTTDRMWRKTRSDHHGGCIGVDGNRNFPEGWGGTGSSDNQCSETYRGPSPMSESEIWNIDAFMNPIAHNFRLAYTLHSYGQFTVYPWGYTTDYDVEDAADYDNMGPIHIDAINAVHNSGYTWRRSNGDMAGNTIDWAKGAMNIKYAWLMETRDTGEYGFLLPEDQILPTDEELWAGMKAMCLAILAECCTP